MTDTQAILSEGWTALGKRWLAAGAPLGEDYARWIAPHPTVAKTASCAAGAVSPDMPCTGGTVLGRVL